MALTAANPEDKEETMLPQILAVAAVAVDMVEVMKHPSAEQAAAASSHSVCTPQPSSWR